MQVVLVLLCFVVAWGCCKIEYLFKSYLKLKSGRMSFVYLLSLTFLENFAQNMSVYCRVVYQIGQIKCMLWINWLRFIAIWVWYDFQTDIVHHRVQSYHYIDVIMTTMASQITSLMVVYSNVYSGTDKRKYQSSASLVFVRGIHRDRWIPLTKGQ